MRIHLIPNAEIEGETRPDPPGLGAIEGEPSVAVGVIRSAGYANSIAIPNREIVQSGIQEVAGVPRGRGNYAELRRTRDEIRNLNSPIHDIAAVADRVIAARVSLVVAR